MSGGKQTSRKTGRLASRKPLLLHLALQGAKGLEENPTRQDTNVDRQRDTQRQTDRQTDRQRQTDRDLLLPLEDNVTDKLLLLHLTLEGAKDLEEDPGLVLLREADALLNLGWCG
jgi:uncharacterized protein with GYD domain